MAAEHIIYDRNVLYDEIWAEPMRTVAERYGVSDVWLAKTCRSLDVPVPGRGYWAKRQVGKAPPRPPLPPLADGAADRIVGMRYEAPPQAEPLAGLDAAEPLELPAPVVVAESLERPHKLVTISARYLQKATPRGGVVSAERSTCLDISVSPASLDRALAHHGRAPQVPGGGRSSVEIAAIDEPPAEDRSSYDYGYNSRPREREPRPPERVTRVLCDEEWIQFRLTERVRRLRDQGPPAPDGSRSRWETAYDYEPTGELSLELTNVTAPGVRTKWKESKKQRLENLLSEFVAYLPTVALSFKLEREEEERRRIEAREAEIRRYEEQKRRWEEEERQRKEKEREEAFEAEVAAWHRARDIRDYAEAALASLPTRQLSPEDEQAERERLSWALRFADRLDPLTK